MVKTDALFSYVAPGNVFAWAFIPLRYCMPLKQFVLLNRFVIKITHSPILFCIYIYERHYLASYMYEPTDLVENPGRIRHRSLSFGDPESRTALFSPSVRVREESVVGYQKDRALEEVFRRIPGIATLRTQRRNERRKTQNAIRSWMDQHEGTYHSPHNYSTIESRLGNDWQQRQSISRDRPRRYPRQFSDIRSAASDPADLVFDAPYARRVNLYHDGVVRRDYGREVKDSTDADGDDELVTNDEDEEEAVNHLAAGDSSEAIVEDYFTTPVATRFTNPDYGGTKSTSSPRPGTARRNPLHHRTLSTNTILYAPSDDPQPSSPSTSAAPGPSSRPRSSKHTPIATPTNGRRSPRRSMYITPGRPHSTLPPRDIARTAPNRTPLVLDIPTRNVPARRRSSVDQDADSDLNVAMAADETFSGAPSSFTTQMAMANAMLSKSAQTEDSNRMSKLMLSKMKTLEKGLDDMVREVKDLRSTVASTAHNSGDDGRGSAKKRKSDSRPSSAGLGSPGLAVIEVSGREKGGSRRFRTSSTKTHERRLTRRRSTREWVGEGPIPGTEYEKWKGKEKMTRDDRSSTDDDDDDDGEPRKLGSSV